MSQRIKSLIKRLQAFATQGVAGAALLAAVFASGQAAAEQRPPEQRHAGPHAGPGASGAASQDQAERPPASGEARIRMNNGTVGIISDGKYGVAPAIVADLSVALNEGDDLRVLPLMGEGSQQNIFDLLYLKGVDIAVVQTDVLYNPETTASIPDLHSRIDYIAKLFDKEIHLLARRDIASIQDLAGKKVSFDLKNSSASLTARRLFDSLAIAVDPVYDHPAVALKKLKLGQIDAFVSVEPKPWDFLRSVANDSDIHFLNIEYGDALGKTYLPASLTSEDYPGLVGPGVRIDTIAVGSVMAVFNWQSQSDRRRKVTKFVEALFSHFERLQNPPAHPKWRKVNLAATVPGWTRFPAAQRLIDEKRKDRASQNRSDPPLDAAAAPEGRDRFAHSQTAQTGAPETGGGAAPPAAGGPREEQLRQEFLRWWEQQPTR